MKQRGDETVQYTWVEQVVYVTMVAIAAVF